MERQFVIHMHTGHGQLHYDLMLAHGEALATWQLPLSPAAMEIGDSLDARKLGDHRVAYLSYEGPVSRGRGEVTILDRGSFQLLTQRPGRWEVVFNGEKIAGRFEFVHCGPDADAWALRRVPEA